MKLVVEMTAVIVVCSDSGNVGNENLLSATGAITIEWWNIRQLIYILMNHFFEFYTPIFIFGEQFLQ